MIVNPHGQAAHDVETNALSFTAEDGARYLGEAIRVREGVDQ
jgi:hypothetical protein